MMSGGLSIRSALALRTAERALARLRWLTAAARFELAAMRHARALKAGFNPNQPRVPRGNPDGGQWTGSGGRAGERPVRLASSEGPRIGPRSKLTIAAELARQAIKLFRDENFLYDLFGRGEGVVAYTNLDGAAIYGLNSGSSGYKDRDMTSAEALRHELIAKHPDIMATENTGQMPNNAVFHAETTVLLRAAKANGGSLAGKVLEVHVDRPLCSSCDRILPLIGLEIGDPTVTFVGPSGFTKTMRGGSWIK